MEISVQEVYGINSMERGTEGEANGAEKQEGGLRWFGT